MNKINLFLLVVISLIAICVDCYAGYAMFLMFAMPIGHYLSPFLLLFLVLSVPIVFISSVIGLFYLKRLAYWVFFGMTVILHSFLVFFYIYDLVKRYDVMGIKQVFLLAFFIVFTIYFLLPSTRSLFSSRR
jgi:hypothetical protein